MKEGDNYIVDILNYLFKTLARNAPEVKGDILNNLVQYGFDLEDIQDAVAWFLNLLVQQNGAKNGVMTDAVRIFLPHEMDKIGQEGCNFMLLLERLGILDAHAREITITQILQMPGDQCSLEEVKWVILMVLMSQNKLNGVIDRLEKYSLLLSGNKPSHQHDAN